jgi:actin-related protein 9
MIIPFASRHVVAVGLGLGAKPVNYLFLLSVPSHLPPGAWERVTQIFFESLCVSSFMIVERALLQLYSCAAVSGIVVEIEADFTQVSIVYDTQICHACTMQTDIGEKDCDLYLANLLLETNPDLPQQLAAEGQSTLQGPQLQEALLRLVSVLKDGEWIKVTATMSGSAGANGAAGGLAAAAGEEEEEGITDVAKALASGKVAKLLAKGGSADGITLDAETDTLLVPHPTSANKQAIAIGAERHRYAEPLFDPSVLHMLSSGLGGAMPEKVNALSVQALIAAAVQRYPAPEHRSGLWDSIILTGGLARVRGLAPTLVNLLQKYARESPINPQDTSEKRQARHQKTPEYFSEYRERPDLTGFLGGCIYAKVPKKLISSHILNKLANEILPARIPRISRRRMDDQTSIQCQ